MFAPKGDDMKKYKEITLLSAFLCLAVIMIHITATPATALEWGSVPHVFIFALNRGLSFAVPGFIFLSGFKLYSKYGQKKMSLGEFFRGRLLKIAVPYLIALAAYFACMRAVGWATFAKIPEYVFLGTLAAHFYYIVIAVQLYILFPILKCIFDRFPIPLTVIALASTVVFNQLVIFPYSDRFFGTYIFYFVLGMCYSRYKPHLKSKALGAIFTALTLLVGGVHFTTLYLALWKVEYYKYYGAVSVLYFTLAIAALMSIAAWVTDKWDAVYKCARVLDAASYEIYLYHLLLVIFVERFITPRLALTPRWQFVVSFALLYGAAAAYAIIKHKLLKRKKTAV